MFRTVINGPDFIRIFFNREQIVYKTCSKTDTNVITQIYYKPVHLYSLHNNTFSHYGENLTDPGSDKMERANIICHRTTDKVNLIIKDLLLTYISMGLDKIADTVN